MTKEWTIGKLLSTSSAYWRGCALQAAVRLDVFTLIYDAPLQLSEIAAAAGTDIRGTEYLLNALAAMGLLVKENDYYADSAAARELLCRQSERYMGHIIMHHHHLLDSWAQLDEAVRRGAPVAKRSYGDEQERESFLLGMFNLAMGTAPRLAAEVDLSGRKRLLDLGGGPGTHAIHFCRANPELSGVIYDRPTTESFARQTIRKFGMEERIDFMAGDFSRDPISGGPYDAAWLSHILHGSGPETCREIIAGTVKVMEPGGLILIHEFILDNDKAGPEFPALFALNMLVNNPEGRSYSEEELRDMLAEAGVADIKRHPYRGPNDSSVIYGTTGK